MTKKSNREIEFVEGEDDDDAGFNIEDSDYGFILDADGNLKAMFLSEEDLEYSDLPENVQKVMEIFGVTDLDDLTIHTLH